MVVIVMVVMVRALGRLSRSLHSRGHCFWLAFHRGKRVLSFARGNFVFRCFDLAYRKAAHAAELTTFTVLISANCAEAAYRMPAKFSCGIFRALLDIGLGSQALNRLESGSNRILTRFRASHLWSRPHLHVFEVRTAVRSHPRLWKTCFFRNLFIVIQYTHPPYPFILIHYTYCLRHFTPNGTSSAAEKLTFPLGLIRHAIAGCGTTSPEADGS